MAANLRALGIAGLAGARAVRICFVNMPLEYFSPVSGGAISTIIAELSAELIQLGHQVDVVSYSDGNEMYDVPTVHDLGAFPERNKVVRVVDRLTRSALRRPFPGYEQYRRRVRGVLRTLRPAPEVVVAFNDFAVPRFARRVVPDVRTVTWLQNEPPTHRASDLNAPDMVIATSDFIRDRAIETGVLAVKAHTILNGVNLETFHPDAAGASEHPRVLLVGRLDPNKGFHVALAALKEARLSRCEFDTTLAGARWWYGAETPTTYELELFASVDELGGKYVGLVPRAKIADLFRAHDLVYVLSLSQEPFGLVVLEAMASGCAVIASPRGGIPQAAGGAALLVEPDDFAAVVGATVRLLQDPAELRAWKDRAMTHAASSSWRARAMSFAALLESTSSR